MYNWITLKLTFDKLPPLSMLSHIDFLCVALDEARKCVPTLTAFCVGCVITASHGSSEPAILATGYSRELPGNTHAEANALAKLSLLSPDEIRDIMLVDIPSIDGLSMDVYTTLVYFAPPLFWN